ncbi:PREDICTED: uncharacterized protein LOC107182329 [Myotis davidii]|uniref:uncharacterized protein LOC107182329 n=1 Tax=Myotis davidii TaxID=225400 RepID=UPI000767374F|nr:PREDICTED: uncharacterized protein LOC107182329 [Myotis davidii]
MVLRACIGPRAGRSPPLLCGVLPSPGSSRSLGGPSAGKATFGELAGRGARSQGRADLAGQEDFEERTQLQHLLRGARLGLKPLVAQLVELCEGLGGEVPEQVGDVQVGRGPPAGGLAFLRPEPLLRRQHLPMSTRGNVAVPARGRAALSRAGSCNHGSREDTKQATGSCEISAGRSPHLSPESFFAAGPRPVERGLPTSDYNSQNATRLLRS